MKKTLVLALSFLLPSLLLAQVQWKPLGPYGGGVRSLVMDPNNHDVLYAGTSDSQIYKTEDGGKIWKRLEPGIARRRIVLDDLHIDPRDSNVIYAGGWALNYEGGGLFKSTDGGKTWLELPVDQRAQTVTAVALAPSNPDILVVGTLRGVFRSEDGGKSWRTISEGTKELINLESVAIDPSDPNVIYAGTSHLGYKTTDGGAHWTLIDRGMIEDSHVFTISVDSKTPAVVFAGACSGIYKSVSGGQRWEKLKNGFTYDDRRTRTSRIDPLDSRIVYIGTTRGLFKSVDAGGSWKRLTKKDLTVNAIVIHPKNNNVVYLATEAAGILKSTDGGAHFEQANNGFIHRSVAYLQTDPNVKGRIYAGVVFDGSYGGVFRSEDGGETWRQISQGILDSDRDVYTILMSSRDPKTLYAGTSHGMYKSANGGESWSKLVSNELQTVIYDLKFLSPSENEILAATEHGLYKYSAAARRWVKVLIPKYRGKIFALALSQASPRAVYAAGPEGLHMSGDGGKTWIYIKPPEPSVRRVALDPHDSNVVYVGTSKGLFGSTDGGKTWQKLSKNAYEFEVSKILIDPRDLEEIWMADMSFGLIAHSKNRGKDWEITNLQTSGISTLVLDPFNSETLYAGTTSDGVCLISKPSGQGSGR